MENLIIKSITVLLCVTIISASGCSINKQNKLADMVKAGQDPQNAACAIYVGYKAGKCRYIMDRIKPVNEIPGSVMGRNNTSKELEK